MPRATTKSQLLGEIARDRREMDELPLSIPADRKLEDVESGHTIKDLLAASDRVARIKDRFAGVPLERVEADLADVHSRLYAFVEAMDEDELFVVHYDPFTGSTTLAAYVTSASATHYRSATKLIRRWWKAQQPAGTSA